MYDVCNLALTTTLRIEINHFLVLGSSYASWALRSASNQLPGPFVFFRLDHKVPFRDTRVLRAELDDKVGACLAIQGPFHRRNFPSCRSLGRKPGSEIGKAHERVLSVETSKGNVRALYIM
jgi:hypothetical protein